MNIDELRHAAERYWTKEIRHEDRSMLAEFATLLLDTSTNSGCGRRGNGLDRQ